MAFTSTIPGAIATVQGYMNTVAASTSVEDVNVYVGYSVTKSALSYNYMMVGDYADGLLVSPTDGDWLALPAAAKFRSENYSVLGHIRTWSGGQDWQSRLDDAFSLLNAFQELVISDPGGSGTLTPPGSWGALNWTMEENGPLGEPTGWGVVLGFELQVLNVQIIG